MTVRPAQRLPESPHALFVYGTLRFPEVLTALLSRVPGRTPATVAGWRVAALPGRTYPALARAAGVSASGLVLADLTPAEWRVLDDYEDPFYDLTELPLTAGGTAWSYTAPDDHPVSAHDWRPDRFAARHLAAFTARLTA